MIDVTDQQEEAAQWLATHNGVLLATPGTGKTRTVLRMLEATNERALIVAPATVARRVWTDEATLVFNQRIIPLIGNETKRWALFKENANALDDPHMIISYESFPWLVRYAELHEIFDVIVFDEISRMRNPAGARAKLVKKQVAMVKHRIGLTGTPAANHLHHIYGQLKITAGLDMIHEQWLKRFFSPRQVRVGAAGRASFLRTVTTWEANENTLTKIRPFLDLHTHTMASATPDAVRTIDHWVEVPAPCRNVEIGAAVVAQQYAQGRRYRLSTKDETLQEAQDNVESLHSAKQDALVTLLHELQGEPVLVFYAFRHDLLQIKTAAGLAKVQNAEYPTDASVLADLIAQWNAREIELLCVHPGSAGHGLNLQAGGHQIVWFGLPWDVELYEQGVRRLHRRGQTRTVMNHRILAEQTIDVEMIAQIERKRDAAAPVMYPTREEPDDARI